MNKLKRYRGRSYIDGVFGVEIEYCTSEDVATLESQLAESERRCAELESIVHPDLECNGAIGGTFDYPAAARAIAVWLDDYCDKSLPYPQMITDAVRLVVGDIESENDRVGRYAEMARVFAEEIERLTLFVLSLTNDQIITKSRCAELLGISIVQVRDTLNKHIDEGLLEAPKNREG